MYISKVFLILLLWLERSNLRVQKQTNIGRRRPNAIDAFKIASILPGDSLSEKTVRVT